MLFMLVKKPHKKHIGRKEGFLIKKLGFSDEQEQQFLSLDAVHRDKMKGYDEEIIMYKKGMFDAFVVADEIQIDLPKKIGALEAKKEEEVFRFFRKVNKICNKEQAEGLKRIIKKAIVNSGRNSQRPPVKESGMHPGDRFPPPHKNN